MYPSLEHNREPLLGRCMFLMEAERSRISLHRVDRARKEVRQQNGKVHPVSIQNKTSGADSGCTPQQSWKY